MRARLTSECLALEFLIALLMVANANAQDPTLLLQWGSAGTGQGQFINIQDLDVSPTGKVIVADYGTGHIQVFDTNGTFIAWWYASCSCNGSPVPYLPTHVAVDGNDYVYVANYYDNTTDRYRYDGSARRAWSTFPSNALAVGLNGHIYATSVVLGCVAELDTSGVLLRQWGTNGSGVGQFQNPNGIAVGPDGSVYVTDRSLSRVQRFAVDGTYLSGWGSPGAGNGQFDLPNGIDTDAQGNVYVADVSNYRVQVFSANGVYLAQWAISADPEDVALDTMNNEYVTNGTRVQKYGRPSTPVRSMSWGAIKSAYR